MERAVKAVWEGNGAVVESCLIRSLTQDTSSTSNMIGWFPPAYSESFCVPPALSLYLRLLQQLDVCLPIILKRPRLLML